MQYIAKRKKVTLILALVCSILILAILPTALASAANKSDKSDKIDPGSARIFQDMCAALLGIKGQKLWTNEFCGDKDKQSIQDANAKKICDTYGGGRGSKGSQLKDICKKYNDYVPGSFTPRAGGPKSPVTVGAKVPTHDTCGAGDDAVGISINIGCKGKGNPIADGLFAVIRVLSNGVGLVVIGSIIVGGIQYSASRGDPQATAMAVNRIRSSLIALLIYIFGYAILNFIIPQGFLG